MKGEGVKTRASMCVRALLTIVPFLAMVLLHAGATRLIVSAPLRLLLYGSAALSVFLFLLGWRARYRLPISRVNVASVLLATVCVSVVALWLLNTQVSQIQARCFVCLMPIMWSALWGLYYLCGDAGRESYAKLLASVSAAYIGLAVVFLIWYMGGIDVAMKYAAPERFPYTFGIWDSVPAREHMFMMFDNRWNRFEEKKCYHGYTLLFTFPHYLGLKFIRWYTALPYGLGIRLSAFAYGIIFSFVIPLCTSYRMHFSRTSKVSFLAWLCLPMLLVLSIPDLWTALFRYDGDNSFPLFALCVYASTCVVGRALERTEPYSWALAYLMLAFLSVLNPILWAGVGITLLMLSLGIKRREILVCGVVSLVLSIGTYVLMGVVAQMTGWAMGQSSIVVRSGLSTGAGGSLLGAWAAFVNPLIQNQMRPYSFVWLAFYTSVIAIIANCFIAVRKPSSNLIFLLLAPLVFDLVAFSQSHSNHPYLYDIPVSVLGGLSIYWVASSDEGEERSIVSHLRPWVALLFVCGAFGNVMALRAFFLQP